MSEVAWPGRGNRGKGSQERRAVETLKKNQSMTAVALDAGKYRQCLAVSVRYNPHTDRVETDYVTDRSLTKTQHLALFDKRASLLLPGNPFQMAQDLKEQTPHSKRIQREKDTTKFDRK
jgi:hypothetical protein